MLYGKPEKIKTNVQDSRECNFEHFADSNLVTEWIGKPSQWVYIYTQEEEVAEDMNDLEDESLLKLED